MIEEVSPTFIKAGDRSIVSNVMNVDFGTEAFHGSKGRCAVSYPAEWFSSISDAIHDIHQGKMLMILGGEEDECKGYVMVAASRISPESVDFLLKQGTGTIYITVNGEHVVQLHAPCMNLGCCSAARVSATDLANTILALASRESNFEHFYCSGPVSLLKYSEGGVLERAGHAEAAVDLTVLQI